MPDKCDSLISILSRIDSNEPVTVESLHQELERSKRTVYRYISTLQTVGFPIEYDHVHKTYGFMNGYTLKKPHLSIEEALAFSLARKLLGTLTPGCRRTWIKLKRSLALKDPRERRM